MKTILVCLLILSAVSCSPPSVTPQIHSDFLPYLDLYLQEKGRPLYYLELSIKYANLGHEVIGSCTKYRKGDVRVVEFDLDCWMQANENKKTSLFFHEMGHCDLDRGHLNDLDNSGFAVSFMREVNEPFDYSRLLYYFNEMFEPNHPGYIYLAQQQERCKNEFFSFENNK